MNDAPNRLKLKVKGASDVENLGRKPMLSLGKSPQIGFAAAIIPTLAPLIRIIAFPHRFSLKSGPQAGQTSGGEVPTTSLRENFSRFNAGLSSRRLGMLGKFLFPSNSVSWCLRERSTKRAAGQADRGEV